MAISEYTINWSAFENAGTIDFNLTNVTAQELMNRIPENANNMTDGYYGIVVLIIMGIFLYWVLTDKTQYGYFKYSEIRGLGISLGVISIFAAVMLSIGYMVNIMHAATLVTLYTITVVYTALKNPS
jgi:hypothetical protein